MNFYLKFTVGNTKKTNALIVEDMASEQEAWDYVSMFHNANEWLQADEAIFDTNKKMWVSAKNPDLLIRP